MKIYNFNISQIELPHFISIDEYRQIEHELEKEGFGSSTLNPLRIPNSSLSENSVQET